MLSDFATSVDCISTSSVFLSKGSTVCSLLHFALPFSSCFLERTGFRIIKGGRIISSEIEQV